LGGEAALPVPDLRDREIPARDVASLEHTSIQRGERLYNENCAVCHGFLARSGGAIPDLRRISEGSLAAWDQIVIDGVLSANGMASFGDVLNQAQSGDVLSYVKARAEEDRLTYVGEKDLPRMTWLDGAE
ncbi:MAG: c-type cytochrome, partial [Pseudomonadales bacterium]